MPDILHLVTIHASPNRLYRALTTAQGIRRWWTHDSDLGSKPGSTGEFRFHDRRFAIAVNVDELKRNAHVGWNNVTSTGGSFNGTTIEFDIRSDDEDTMLAFAHRGFKEAGDAYAGAALRWGYYLISLKQFLETGKGTPHPYDIFI
jgi:uncharacterized protein YndB with AHSA1/START domain